MKVSDRYAGMVHRFIVFYQSGITLTVSSKRRKAGVLVLQKAKIDFYLWLTDSIMSYSSRICTLLTLLCAIFVGVGAFLRYSIGWAVLGGDEAGGWFVAITTYLMLGFIAKEGGHIKVTLFGERSSVKVRRVIEMFNLVLPLFSLLF
ncbi:TRAP transporter small permease subunit [Candidatus Poribacteria bacterium]|nr:TRAP transporter small permease subunit [Candidatus Poribacteria bacterium]